jgi:predicted RNA-binding protein with TRAM domain
MAYGDRFGGGDRYNERRSFAPVKVGDEIDVKIEAVGEKGDGVAKKDGFVLFVPNTNAGDEVKVKVTKVLRRVGFAEVVGKSEGNVEAEAPADEAQSEEVAEEPAEEPQAEDTEDFGEEPAEEEPKEEEKTEEKDEDKKEDSEEKEEKEKKK